ncbi:glycine cleavage system aminomethyltransferase GcvT [Ilumatobacter sp.]|uniref:glycine cleavage system aminomethyltransferase GcvT n=1 Tax=Ilumatobacter sp. TaxID=1967498 RepID=UPI003B51D053
MSERRSPLADRHEALHATMVDFGGWRMPIAYPTGTIAEHVACRSAAAVFDVSHLGTVRVEGAGALDRLQTTLTNDLGRIAPGRAQYTHLLDAHDASVLDDIIVWWHPRHERVDGTGDVFDVMPNASNTERVLTAIGGDDTTTTRAVIALQGPEALALAAEVVPDAAAVGRFRVEHVGWGGTSCVVAGTGYTGEPGIEIAVPIDAAGDLWDALVGGGATPAGLGARDTLRLEAGLPLHGQELGPGITSLQAGLGWVVAWDKPDFTGREAALAERASGVGRHLVGIALDGRRPARAGSTVVASGIPVGTVTSGNFSPILGHAIALALIDATIGEGDAVELDVRGRPLPGHVTSPPFV